jgi:hypothetical protein
MHRPSRTLARARWIVPRGDPPNDDTPRLGTGARSSALSAVDSAEDTHASDAVQAARER